MNKNNFVIYSTGRSGSYLLVDYLNQFEDIICHGELFKPRRIDLSQEYKEQMKLQDVSQRDNAPLKYLNKVYGLTPNQYIGFKMFPSHNHQIKKRLLNEQSVRKVLLIRNEIEVYLSTLMAAKTRVWIERKGQSNYSLPDPDSHSITFKPEEFVHRHDNLITYYLKISERLKKSNQEYFKISYNEVVEKDRIYDLVQFIKGEKAIIKTSLVTNLKKQINRGYAEVVLNYDQMMEFLYENYSECLKNSKLWREKQG